MKQKHTFNRNKKPRVHTKQKQNCQYRGTQQHIHTTKTTNESTHVYEKKPCAHTKHTITCIRNKTQTGIRKRSTRHAYKKRKKNTHTQQQQQKTKLKNNKKKTTNSIRKYSVRAYETPHHMRAHTHERTEDTRRCCIKNTRNT